VIPFFQFNTISFGPITIQVWGLLVACGLLVASLIIWKRSKRLGFNPEQLLDMVLWMVVLGFVFSRVFHVVFYDLGFYISNPIDVLKIWEGGLSSFGGIFGAGVGVFLFIKKHKISKLDLLVYLDIMTFGAVFGWMIGRLGCFAIHDHWGIPCSCPLAINTPEGGRLDMALLEILGMIPLAFIFLFFRKRKMFAGWFLAVLFVYYGVLRFILDFFRATDIVYADARYFGLTPAQYFAIVLVGIGIYILWGRKNKK